jgi:hypothetical protein
MTRPRRCPLLRHRQLVRGPSTGSEDALGRPRMANIRPRGRTCPAGRKARTSARRACRFDHRNRALARLRTALRWHRRELTTRCLNLLAAVGTMPQAGWQCLNFSGTRQRAWYWQRCSSMPPCPVTRKSARCHLIRPVRCPRRVIRPGSAVAGAVACASAAVRRAGLTGRPRPAIPAGPTSMAHRAVAPCHPRRPAQVRGPLPGPDNCHRTHRGVHAGRGAKRCGQLVRGVPEQDGLGQHQGAWFVIN